MLTVRAPVRVDLAGGTLDLWPLYCLHPGSLTVNVAIAAGVQLRIESNAAPAGAMLLSSPRGETVRLCQDDAGSDLAATVAFHFAPAGGLAVAV